MSKGTKYYMVGSLSANTPRGAQGPATRRLFTASGETRRVVRSRKMKGYGQRAQE